MCSCAKSCFEGSHNVEHYNTSKNCGRVWGKCTYDVVPRDYVKPRQPAMCESAPAKRAIQCAIGLHDYLIPQSSSLSSSVQPGMQTYGTVAQFSKSACTRVRPPSEEGRQHDPALGVLLPPVLAIEDLRRLTPTRSERRMYRVTTPPLKPCRVSLKDL